MDKLKKYCKDNNIIIFSTSIIVFFQSIYLSNSTANIPIMDYWRYLSQFADKTFLGEISFDDMWIMFASHRSPLTYFLFVLNMKIFGLNTQIDIYLGTVVTTICIFVIYNMFKQQFTDSKSKTIGQIYFVLIELLMFNPNKWEIVTLQFSLSFAIKVLAFICLFKFINNFNLNIEVYGKKVYFFCVYLIATICLIASAYFPAMCVAIAVALVCGFFSTKKEEKKKYLIKMILIYISMFIGAFIYLNGGEATSNAKVNFDFTYFLNLFKGMLIMLANSVLHNNVLTKYQDIKLIYIVGVLIFLIYIFVVFIFFKFKIYKITYMPIMLIVYTFANILLIYYGRSQIFDLAYLGSSRYIYETSLGLIGILWIVYIFICNNVSTKKLLKIILTIQTVVIMVCIILSFLEEKNMEVKRKANCLYLIGMAQSIEERTDEELIFFQANNSQQVRDGIDLMKKYNLGIFKYIDSENEKQQEE